MLPRIAYRHPHARRRFALLLTLATLLNCFAPFGTRLFATAAASPLASPPAATDFVRQLPLTANDIIYSPSTKKLYASVPSSVGASGNSITAIDPESGTVGASTFVGSEPNRLAISSDGQTLYTTLEGAFSIRRFDLTTNTPGQQFPIGQSSFDGALRANDLAVAPGNPDVVAVARYYQGVSPSEAGVAIFDKGVQRTKTGPGHIVGSDFLAYSASESKLYGGGYNYGLRTMTVDSTGVTVNSTTSFTVGARIKFDNGLIYSSSGQVINPDTSTLLGTFADATSNAFVSDSSVGRAYYLRRDNFGSGPLILKAYDTTTFLPVGSLSISGVQGDPVQLVRWGANGLAFCTTSNQVYLIQTSLIPSSAPIPDPTPVATPSPTPTPVPSPAAFVRQISLVTNDLLYNSSTKQLYASVPSSVGASGNSITAIDPESGTVGASTFVGSEPNKLALSDNNQVLYVGLNGAGSVRRFDVSTMTAGTQFYLGNDTYNGPPLVNDIAVMPGHPETVAVSAGGTAVYDNGTKRTNTTTTTGSIEFGSETALYIGGNGAVYKMTVGPTGITTPPANTVYSAGYGAIIYSNGLVYTSSGRVIDPNTGVIKGSFTGVGFDSTFTVDEAQGRIYFLTNQNSNWVLRSYDINTFLPLQSLTVTGLNGATPFGLTRWGSNGLAFRTNAKVFLIQTAMVNAADPVPTPTPTPSPTPTPTPPNIATFVRQVDLPTNDLVYNTATASLYASVPSSAGAIGNSITPINPQTGVVGTSTFVGSEPNKLALADDGKTLYTTLDGASAIRRFDISTQTAGAQFTPSSAFAKPYEIAVAPGNPNVLALAGGFSGAAIYDNGVLRPNYGRGMAYGIYSIAYGPGPETLYGYDNYSSGFELVKFSVDNTGLTPVSLVENLVSGYGAQIKYVNGLIYSSLGRVVDPQAQQLLGTFQNIAGGNGSYTTTGIVVDTTLKRVFFLSYNFNNTVAISAYDTETFLPTGVITIPNVTGTPSSLLRWGANGIAFRTGSTSTGSTVVPGRVYLVQTALVPAGANIPTGVGFNLANNFVFESSQNISVTVTRSGDLSGTTTVDYATSDGTAVAGSDYTAKSGTLTFAPGEASKVITIAVKDDNVFEGNETFNLTLSNLTGSGVLVNPSTTTVTIQDNDSQPSVQVIAKTVQEPDTGTSTAAIEVRLSNPTTKTVTVNYITSDGTAKAGSDYVAASGTVTFNPLETSKTIPITINADDTTEQSETFNVTLSNPTNAFTFSGPIAITIIDSSIVTLSLSDSGYQVGEADSSGTATITVNRTGGMSTAVSVDYITGDQSGLVPCQTNGNGVASERCDYAKVAGTLRFAAGEKTKTVQVPVVNDAYVEPVEFFTFSLRNPQGANLGTSIATVTIVDDDTQQATTNPIEEQGFFIKQQYIDFLGRVAEPAGFDFWNNRMNNCPQGQTCDRIDTSQRFFQSDEFQERGGYVYRLYDGILGRLPRYSEFVPDVAKLSGFQTVQEQRLSKDAYLLSFISKGEFRSLYAPYLSADGLTATDAAGFVNALCARSGITPASKQTLIDNLQNKTKDPAHTVEDFILTPEMSAVGTKFYDRGFITMQYFGYLRRDPDVAGFNFWVGQLMGQNAPHKGDYRFMVGGFLQSDEYCFRFALISHTP